jgi:hypothetical protein
MNGKGTVRECLVGRQGCEMDKRGNVQLEMLGSVLR